MGYESRVYVIEESPYRGVGELPWGDVIAMFDLCKMNYDLYYGKSFPSLFNKERTCEFYADDGNTLITEDYYGEEVKKADSEEVIKWLKAYFKNGNEWYRAKAFYATLLSLEKEDVAYSLYHFGC